jgi:hypothetical protein
MVAVRLVLFLRTLVRTVRFRAVITAEGGSPMSLGRVGRRTVQSSSSAGGELGLRGFSGGAAIRLAPRRFGTRGAFAITGSGMGTSGLGGKIDGLEALMSNVGSSSTIAEGGSG